MEFYETYGSDFSKSRFRIWPQVRDFVKALPTGAKVLDIGCGNGKNMGIRKDLQMIGFEQSSTLCEICAKKGLEVVQGDARSLPFPNNSFDAVIMIAVLHHLPPIEQRTVLFEIKRVLQSGGVAMITCWAVEQPPSARRKFVRGLNLVEWSGREELPLMYWVQDEADAKELGRSLPHGLECTSIVWNAGNWNHYLTKI